MKQIKLSEDKYALVDDEDYPYLNRFKWSLGEGNNAMRTIGNASLFMVSLIATKGSNEQFTFKDRNPLNLQKENILPLPYSNAVHKAKKVGKPTTSQYKGVSWCATKERWQALISKQGKRYHGGYFRDEIDAAKRYNELAYELYGETAYQNDLTPKSSEFVGEKHD